MKAAHKLDLIVSPPGPFTSLPSCAELCLDVSACAAFAFSKSVGECELYHTGGQDEKATFRDDQENEKFALWDRVATE